MPPCLLTGSRPSADQADPHADARTASTRPKPLPTVAWGSQACGYRLASWPGTPAARHTQQMGKQQSNTRLGQPGRRVPVQAACQVPQQPGQQRQDRHNGHKHRRHAVRKCLDGRLAATTFGEEGRGWTTVSRGTNTATCGTQRLNWRLAATPGSAAPCSALPGCQQLPPRACLSCAFSTSRTIWESAVSEPTLHG